MKLAIVNDSPMVVETLRRLIQGEGKHEIIWVAENGKIAVEKCSQQVPDLMLMDLIMPIMNGVESTRQIMKYSPCPILVVTSSVSGNSGLVFEAMGAGALDVVATPILFGHNGTGGHELLEKINRIGKLVGIKDSSASKKRKPVKGTTSVVRGKDKCLVAIGCSTGGPQALLRILQVLPAEFPASVVVIQHMDEQFSGGMASWLNGQVPLAVRTLQVGEQPQPGVVLIPSTNNHVVMKPNNALNYSIEPKEYFYHPSVDVFFTSVARYWQGKCIGVLLTGMGRDGADGLLALHQQGCLTIAQDERSCIVYGMPKAAIELGAAGKILPLDAIGSTIKNEAAVKMGQEND